MDNLLVELHELLDRYYNEGGIFNYYDFFTNIEIDFPGWSNLVETIERFKSKFISVIKYYPSEKIYYVSDESDESD